MKISYMQKREDFYGINQKTLDKYYTSDKKKTLFIYPELNAIIVRRPSKKVKNYLYVEYKVNSSLLKKTAVFLYTRLALNTFGLFAKKKCKIGENADKNLLIYPCNKKIRVFDFNNNTVRVLPKFGFPTDDIKREIKFRTENSADFIPMLNSFGKEDYEENIIDGYPLARAKHGYNALKDKAYALWQDYVKDTLKEYSEKEYFGILYDQVKSLFNDQTLKNKVVDINKVKKFVEFLMQKSTEGKTVKVGLSHGDLQPGNVWVENKTDKIIIIDWESFGERSTDYDYVTLNFGIRKTSGLVAFLRGDYQNKFTVLFEDLIYKLRELINLPFDYGSKEFDEYTDTVMREIKNV